MLITLQPSPNCCPAFTFTVFPEDNLIRATRPVLLPKTPIKFVLFSSIKFFCVEFPTIDDLLGILGGLFLTFKFLIELAYTFLSLVTAKGISGGSPTKVTAPVDLVGSSKTLIESMIFGFITGCFPFHKPNLGALLS